MKPLAFEFTSYTFDPGKKQLSFTYTQTFSDSKPLVFTEQIRLPQNRPLPSDVAPQLLDQLLQGLHLVLGLSYYKLYCPSKVTTAKPLSEAQADFWNTVYKKGLGEFLYRNNLDPDRVAQFPFQKDLKIESFEYPRASRVLLGIGGGKDSIVAAQLLKEQKFETTALVTETNREHETTTEVIEALGLDLLKIERILDPQIFAQHPESYNGHIPVSAIFAWIGILAGVLYNYRYSAVGNEYSSNFGNLVYRGLTINHQWSKSGEFEILFQAYIREFVTPDVVYFSPLRPFYELRIAQMFAKYPKYFSVFSSCNQVHKIHKVFFAETRQGRVNWCGECPKCAFVFLLLAAFVPKRKLVKIFNKNLLADEKLLPLYTDLLGFGSLKPFDCVGTFDESQAALYLAQKNFKNDVIVKSLIGKVKNGSHLVETALQTSLVSTVPAPFSFVGMKQALIVGYGKEGKVSKQYLKKRYPKLKLSIADREQGDDYLKDQKKFDIAIKTPGIAKRFIDIHYTTATNIFFAEIKNVVIGVTGSKGKSTTASLIAHILKTAGKEVQLLGNIGQPMLGALLKPVSKETIFVVEISSYQLEDLRQSPHIAVVTNLFPEHMDYHEGIENYYKAKQHITEFQKKSDYFVYNPAVEQLNDWAKQTQAISLPFDSKLPVSDQNIPLLGAHNRQNIQAAATVARLLSINDDVLAQAIRTFKPLPHRLEHIGTYQGIIFYDDSISTSPESTMGALQALSNIGTIFLGGEDRGYEFAELEAAVIKKGIKNIVLFPKTGDRLFKIAKDLNILRTTSMAEAVRFAYKHTSPGEIVLLSTASPSYSLWKNFEEKGKEFAKFVKKYSRSKTA